MALAAAADDDAFPGPKADVVAMEAGAMTAAEEDCWADLGGMAKGVEGSWAVFRP